MRFESVRGLFDERDSIGEKQNALCPICALKQIGKSNHGARFARAGCHYDESLALILFAEITLRLPVAALPEMLAVVGERE